MDGKTLNVMKKVYFLSVLALSLCMAHSCEDYRDDYLLGNTVYIRPDATPVRNCSVYSPVQEFGVIRSGALKDGGEVRLGTSATLLVKYNIASGTKYGNMPSSQFSLGNDVLDFGSDDACLLSTVSWDADALAARIASSKDDLVIPLSIVDAQLPVVQDRNLLIIRPVIPSYSMSVSSVRVSLQQGDKNPRQGSATIVLDYPLSDRELTLGLTHDPSLASGFRGSAAPDGFFTLTSSTVTFKAGETSADFTFSIDPAKLYDDDGGWLLSGSRVYSAPVAISSSSVSGLSQGRTVCYIYAAAE